MVKQFYLFKFLTFDYQENNYFNIDDYVEEALSAVGQVKRFCLHQLELREGLKKGKFHKEPDLPPPSL